MAKRTGNSSVNSSIRQNTATTNEGFAQLVAAQEASLGELSSIKKLLEMSKEHENAKQTSSGNIDTYKIQQEILESTKQQLRGSRTYWKTQEEMDKLAYAEADKISELANAMKTFKTMGDKTREKVEGVKEKYGTKAGLKKTVLGALNVGGIFNKTMAKDEFKSNQKAMGYNVSNEDAEGAYNSAKALKAHNASMAKARGNIPQEQWDASPAGKAGSEKKSQLANVYRSYDKSVAAATPDPTEYKLNATAAEGAQASEAVVEGVRAAEKQTELLQKIADNTSVMGGSKAEKKPEAAKQGGILDSIMGFLGPGLMTALKAMFNPMNILKALGKVFAIGMIIGALFEGVMDGFDEYMKTGSIGKALIAGLAGIVDFLTFGLFDKEKIKEVIGDFSAWIGVHIIKPFSEFIGSMKESFMALIENIGIPKINISGLTKYIPGAPDSIGPFYPFKSDVKSPTAAAPNTAAAVEQKSAENDTAKTAGGGTSNKTNVVNAPVTNTSNTTQVIKSPVRNEDPSFNRYSRSRYQSA